MEYEQLYAQASLALPANRSSSV